MTKRRSTPKSKPESSPQNKPTDNLCKRLAETYPEAFAAWLLGEVSTPVTVLKTELSIEPIRADSVTFLALGDEILHIEFQTSAESDPPLDLRMVDYAIRLYRLYRRPLQQVVIVLKETHTPIPEVFRLANTLHRYRVLKMWEQDPTPLLQSEALLPLAVLAHAEPPETLLAQVAAQANAIQNQQRRSDVSTYTQILAGLRFDQDVIYTLFKGGFMRESVIYQEILKEGEQRGEQKGLREGEQKGLREGEQKGKHEGALTFVLHLLSYKLGRLDEQTQQRVRKLTLSQLEQLGEALLEFSSLADLEAWLDSQGV